MRDRACFVCQERLKDFEGGGDDSDGAIVATKEEAFRTGAHTADFVSVEEGLALLVGGIDLADLEEIERLPLYHSLA